MNFTDKHLRSSFRRSLVAACLFLAAAAPGPAAEVVTLQVSGGVAQWRLPPGSGGSSLQVHDGSGVLVSEANFTPGVAPSFKPAGDGIYRWSLSVAPLLSAEQRIALLAARESGRPAPAGLPQGATAAGRLVVQGGTLRDPGAEPGDGLREPAPEDLIFGNLYVLGSMCAGADCVNEQDLGADTIRLKAINTRLKFEDTSTITEFPSNDWQLTANDSVEFGINRFSLEDVTGSQVPFTVMAGAPTDSIFVEASGRIGFGTAIPEHALHTRTSDTPGLRLEQDSIDFGDQIWDILANEIGFS